MKSLLNHLVFRLTLSVSNDLSPCLTISRLSPMNREADCPSLCTLSTSFGSLTDLTRSWNGTLVSWYSILGEYLGTVPKYPAPVLLYVTHPVTFTVHPVTVSTHSAYSYSILLQYLGAVSEYGSLELRAPR